MGGGALTGILGSKQQLTGDQLVYAYPDFKTLLVGPS